MSTAAHTVTMTSANPVAPVETRVAPAKVFAAVLRAGGPQGRLTAVVEGLAHEQVLPVARWAGPVSRGDHFLLGRCRGAVVDLGCGPGRLTEELSRRGHEVLGVDTSEAAVSSTQRRGVAALHRDVLDPLPREGLWDTALLADGNIGIGGDPVALLRRVRRLLRRDGRVVLDLAPEGTGLRVHRVHLRSGGLASTSFPWAELGPDALDLACARAGLVPTALARRGSRWVAVLAWGGVAA